MLIEQYCPPTTLLVEATASELLTFRDKRCGAMLVEENQPMSPVLIVPINRKCSVKTDDCFLNYTVKLYREKYYTLIVEIENGTMSAGNMPIKSACSTSYLMAIVMIALSVTSCKICTVDMCMTLSLTFKIVRVKCKYANRKLVYNISFWMSTSVTIYEKFAVNVCITLTLTLTISNENRAIKAPV